MPVAPGHCCAVTLISFLNSLHSCRLLHLALMAASKFWRCVQPLADGTWRPDASNPVKSVTLSTFFPEQNIVFFFTVLETSTSESASKLSCLTLSTVDRAAPLNDYDSRWRHSWLNTWAQFIISEIHRATDVAWPVHIRLSVSADGRVCVYSSCSAISRYWR